MNGAALAAVGSIIIWNILMAALSGVGSGCFLFSFSPI
jgi:hypothetical protein